MRYSEFQKAVIGETIKRFRMESGLFAWEFAGLLGVSPSTMSRWENGKSVPSEEMCQRMWDEHGLDPLTWVEEE
jgi:DNA-binding transcriptional regulator YiaG